MNLKHAPITLKASDGFWHNSTESEQNIYELIHSEDITTLSREDLVLVVKELDRRFTQLWSKVTYERNVQNK